MSTNTSNLGLLKKDPVTDGLDTFNIQTMLNDNWDKIDATIGPASAATKGVVKIGSGINVDGAGVISVTAVTAPVSSVNGKTGAVVLTSTDIGAATTTQGAKADSALQTSQLGAVSGVAKQDALTEHLAENASDTVKGHVELATVTETTTGTDNTRAIHPVGLKVELDKKISHSLATAVSDFLVSSGAGVFVKKTLPDVKTILGLGTAAYTSTTAYATAAQGTLATNAIPSSQKGAVDGVALHNDVATHLADNATEAVKGHVELATAVETTTGADNTRAITPLGLKSATNLLIPTSQKGIASGVATLNSSGKIPASQASLPKVFTDPETDNSITIFSTTARITSESTSFQKMREILCYVEGTVRLTFKLLSTSSSVTVEGRIYKNDAPIGTIRSTSSSSYVSFIEDFTVTYGDKLQLYLRTTNASGWARCESFFITVRRDCYLTL